MRKPAAPGGLVARSRSAFAHKGKSSALGPSGSVSGGHEVSAPQATEFLSGGQRANILHISLYLVISRYICYISLYPAISGPDIVKYPVQRRVQRRSRGAAEHTHTTHEPCVLGRHGAQWSRTERTHTAARPHRARATTHVTHPSLASGSGITVTRRATRETPPP